MKKIILDCDNTFGIPDCDIDDGLALLYLLGSETAEVIGVTASFGNNAVDVTYTNTVSMLKDIGRTDIPVLKGCAKPGEKHSKASDFIVEMAARYKNELSIVATGGMTNLYAAWQCDKGLYEKINGISLMGGTVAPLVIGGKILDELNFSCDPDAAMNVLKYGKNISVSIGNYCMDWFFRREVFECRLNAKEPWKKWLYDKAVYWFERELEVFGHNGVYNWDVIAAAALVEPEWFLPNEVRISPTLESLRIGNLFGGSDEIPVFLPRMKDGASFEQHVYDQYENALMKMS